LRSLAPDDGRIDKDLLNPIQSPAQTHKVHWIAAIAASIALLAVGIAAWQHTRETTWQVHTTEPGGFARVTLKDGSTVDLNSASEIRVRLTGQRRDVTLTRGEAHFSVMRDANRPFEVAAGGKIVRAVGTAFSVRLRAAKEIDVLVTEGAVAVNEEPLTPALSPGRGRGGKSKRVVAGESAVVRADSIVVQKVLEKEVSQRLAWAAGRLFFSGETLSEAVAEFNRYSLRKLVIEDPAIAQTRIGGNFKASDADAFVSALNDSFGIRAESSGEQEVRLTRTPPP
jgi:transmembrane sensor